MDWETFLDARGETYRNVVNDGPMPYDGMDITFRQRKDGVTKFKGYGGRGAHDPELRGKRAGKAVVYIDPEYIPDFVDVPDWVHEQHSMENVEDVFRTL